MARGRLLSHHRRVVDADLMRFMKNQQDRIRFNFARDSERFEELLDAIDPNRGPVVSRDDMHVEVKR